MPAAQRVVRNITRSRVLALRTPMLCGILSLLLTACINPPETRPGVRAPSPGDTNPGLESYFRPGVYGAVEVMRSGPHCEIYYPVNMDYGRHPILIWGNGTRTSSFAYQDLLRHWASYGVVVVAAMTPEAGTGREMTACLEHILNLNGGQVLRGANPFRGRLNPNRIAAAGHSQGGGGALMLGRDLRITTTIAIQPYVLGLGHSPLASRNQSGPILLLSGSEDTMASPDTHQQYVFDEANVPVTWLTLRGASHQAPMYHGGSYRGPMTAWIRWKLWGDEEAARVFEGPNCLLCQEEIWTIQTK